MVLILTTYVKDYGIIYSVEPLQKDSRVKKSVQII